eukprot:TRINITY_DN8350_c0_g1_i1.p1 TRINITY_DN8350_c0_g1~~TRINITY_DN8350_c0_g1_i1.p1  ORF type:complete len:674 (+),score=167.30 TRINITY_DN8350_c0_g1_i1:52-2022(+)
MNSLARSLLKTGSTANTFVRNANHLFCHQQPSSSSSSSVSSSSATSTRAVIGTNHSCSSMTVTPRFAATSPPSFIPPQSSSSCLSSIGNVSSIAKSRLFSSSRSSWNSSSYSSSSSSSSSSSPLLFLGWSLFGIGAGKAKEDLEKYSVDELIELSRVAFLDGRPKDAERYAAAALKKDPNNWRAYRALAYAYLIMLNIEQCVNTYTSGIEYLAAKDDLNAKRGSVKLMDELASFCLEMDQPDTALEVVRNALNVLEKTKSETDPYWNHFDILLRLNSVKAYIQLSQHDEAIQLCETIDKELTQLKRYATTPEMNEFLSSLDAELRIVRARVLQTPESVRQELETMHRNSSKIPVHCEIWETFLKVDVLAGELFRSNDNDAIAIDAKIEQLEKLLADGIAKAKKMEQEESTVKDVDTPSFLKQRSFYTNKLLAPMLQFQRAMFYMQIQKLKEAVGDLETVLNTYYAVSLFHEAHIAGATLFYNAGALDLALQELEQSLMWGETPGVYLLKGQILLMNEQKVHEARKAIETEIEKFPNSSDPYFALAALNRSQKQYNEAVKNCNDGIAVINKWNLDKSDIILLRAEMAKSYALMGDLNNAQKQIDQSIKLAAAQGRPAEKELVVLQSIVQQARTTLQSTGKNVFAELYDERMARLEAL